VWLPLSTGNECGHYLGLKESSLTGTAVPARKMGSKMDIRLLVALLLLVMLSIAMAAPSPRK